MKKLIVCFVMVVFTISCFAQLTQVSPSYHTVYKWYCMPRHGEIRYNGAAYFLCGQSMNQFENNMHTILLGKTKEEAIESLKQLSGLKDNLGRKDKIDVMGANNRRTTIFKFMGTLCFSTDGVADKTDMLFSLNTEKAINAIKNFNENQ